MCGAPVTATQLSVLAYKNSESIAVYFVVTP